MRAPILAALLVSLPALAAADEPAPPTAVTADTLAGDEAPVPAAELAASERGRHEAPHGDRLLLLPSAETQPARSLSVSVGSDVFSNLGVTYALTDNFQITGQVMLPPAGILPYKWTGSAKWRFFHSDRLRMAAQATYKYIDLFEDSAGAGQLSGGLATSVCIDRSCRSLASASVSVSGLPGAGDFQLVYGGGLTVRLADHLKLVGEGASSASYSDYAGGFQQTEAALVSGGLRLFGEHAAADLGVVKAIHTGDDPRIAQPEAMAFVNLTYRR